MKLQSFKSWFYMQYPGQPLKTIVKWSSTSGILEIPVLRSGKASRGELSITVPSCKHHDISNLRIHMWQGTETEDREPLRIWVVLGVSEEKAKQLWLDNPNPTSYKLGKRPGKYLPTSYPAALKWLEYNKVSIIGTPIHMSDYTPSNGIRGNYYCVYLNLEDPQVLANVPHERAGDGTYKCYLKSYGYQKGSVTLNKLLALAQAIKTEDVCRAYASAFLETQVPGVDVSKIDWADVNVGLQIIKAVKWVNGTQSTKVEEDKNEDESTMGISGFDF